MSSEGCGATVLAAREVLGTSRPKAARTPTTGARTRRAFKIYVPPKSCVLQGGSRRLNHKRRTARQLALLATPYGRRAALQDPPRAVSADGGEVAGRRADALGRVARVKDERARGPAIGRFDVGAEEAAGQRRRADRGRRDVLLERQQGHQAVVDDAEAPPVGAQRQLQVPQIALDAPLRGDRVARAVRAARLGGAEDDKEGEYRRSGERPA